jgi:hypothetical protein
MIEYEYKSMLKDVIIKHQNYTKGQFVKSNK